MDCRTDINLERGAAWLKAMMHSLTCTRRGHCSVPGCNGLVTDTLKALLGAQGFDTSGAVRATRQLTAHWIRCNRTDCRLCVPLWAQLTESHRARKAASAARPYGQSRTHEANNPSAQPHNLSGSLNSSSQSTTAPGPCCQPLTSQLSGASTLAGTPCSPPTPSASSSSQDDSVTLVSRQRPEEDSMVTDVQHAVGEEVESQTTPVLSQQPTHSRARGHSRSMAAATKPQPHGGSCGGMPTSQPPSVCQPQAQPQPWLEVAPVQVVCPGCPSKDACQPESGQHLHEGKHTQPPPHSHVGVAVRAAVMLLYAFLYKPALDEDAALLTPAAARQLHLARCVWSHILEECHCGDLPCGEEAHPQEADCPSGPAPNSRKRGPTSWADVSMSARKEGPGGPDGLMCAPARVAGRGGGAKRFRCSAPGCATTRKLLLHILSCQNSSCEVCSKVRMRMHQPIVDSSLDSPQSADAYFEDMNQALQALSI
ncbi:hypothetical protein V8C86DRAFT_2670920 [Haematococcus lacustris]